MPLNKDALLQVKGVKKYFDVSEGIFTTKKKYLKAVDNVNFSLKQGEILGIVGESGCGKSTLGNLIMQLENPTEGEIIFDGIELSKLSAKELRRKRKDIQMIFQDPYSSLNPRMKVFDIVAEPLRTHKLASGTDLKKQVYDMLEIVGLNNKYANRYPHEFSGGQRQRIGIARALTLKPKLIVCDEPVSALDVSIQAQILNLLLKLQKEFQLTLIFIAHGIPAVKYISNRIAVMYLGKIVEIADKEQLLSNPKHPYTESLLYSVPVSHPKLRSNHEQSKLTGEMPSPVDPPPGCRFHTRCPYADEKCMEETPDLIETQDKEHYVACHYPLYRERVSNSDSVQAILD
ncbi:peptide/nickel transport system ATP-binding protein [Evansella vedderi]|uniref:Peptide/nickel transport system ATP-binding protein n=1 Tax=Evansella vedderi TaxID=38282 RepID=A0ABT9ZYX0_9BACI|nr:oligopeptide/dipeptide ABC transporter ATP-binding protein [Evansella vedderi]MDQ0256432.1 peptide/nickel transport system ATP-binding protein [Evansella vedderi]